MTRKAKEITKHLASYYHLSHEIQWVEPFPPSSNDPDSIDLLKTIASELSLETIQPDSPFPWSEDFGYFLNGTNGALFGLGAGTDHPQLHNPDYDFPDDLIQTGIDIFSRSIISHLRRK